MRRVLKKKINKVDFYEVSIVGHKKFIALFFPFYGPLFIPLYLRQAFEICSVSVILLQIIILYSYIHQRFPFCHFWFKMYFLFNLPNFFLIQDFLFSWQSGIKITFYAADILNWKVVLYICFIHEKRKTIIPTFNIILFFRQN